MKKIINKCLAGVLALSCAAGLAGCNDKNKNENIETTTEFNLTEGVYLFEEKNMGVNAGASITDYYIKGNELYFTYVEYPEYPAELYSDMEDMNEDFEEGLSDEEVPEEETNDKSDGEKEEVTGDSGEMSDDELLGNLDDLFGEDDEDMPADSEEKTQDETEPQEPEDMPDINEEDYMPEIKFCKCDLETFEMTELYDIEYNMEEDSTDIIYYIDDEENKKALTVIYSYNDDAAGGYSSEISVMYKVTDSKGNVVSNEDVSESFVKEGDNPDEVYIDSKGVVAQDGTMYVVVRRNEKSDVVRFADGKATGNLIVEDYLTGIAIDNENNPIGAVINEEGKNEIVRLDFEKGTIGDIIYSPEGEYISGDVISGMANVPFFIKTSTSLSIFDTEKSEKKDILKWIDCGLLGDNVTNVIPHNDGKLLCIYYDNSGQYKIGFLVRQEGEQAEKNVINVTSLYNNYELQQKIIDYNKMNTNLKIEYKSYDDKEDAEKALANDIIAGNIPDILDASYMDINNFIGKGVFEDLTPYIEKDDEINKDYFLDNILDITAVDGKNYYITKYFALNGFCGKKSELGKYADGWSMKDLIEYYNSRPEGKMLVPYESNSTIAHEFLFNNMSAYVNYNTGEVKFDSEDFKAGLEFCKSFPEPSEDEIEVDIRKEIKNGKLILNTTYISEISELQVEEKLFDGDCVFLGYPSDEKKGLAFRNAGETYAISSASDCKDEAWEFVKYIMMSKDEYMQGFPTSKEAFEKLVKRETTTVEYTEEDGTVVKPKEELMEYGNYEIKLTPAKEEIIETFKELLKNSSATSNDFEIAELIEEDLTAYFNDSKSLDETVKIIQDKVSKYVNENK